MTAEQFRTWIAPISQFAALLVVAASVLIWVWELKAKVDGLDGKISGFEGQLKELRATVASQGSSSGTCGSLAERYAAALAQGTRSGDASASAIRALMADVGCMNAPKK